MRGRGEPGKRWACATGGPTFGAPIIRAHCGAREPARSCQDILARARCSCLQPAEGDQSKLHVWLGQEWALDRPEVPVAKANENKSDSAQLCFSGARALARRDASLVGLLNLRLITSAAHLFIIHLCIHPAGKSSIHPGILAAVYRGASKGCISGGLLVNVSISGNQTESESARTIAGRDRRGNVDRPAFVFRWASRVGLFMSEVRS